MTFPHPHTCEDCDEQFPCVDQYRCIEVCGPCQEARWADDDDEPTTPTTPTNARSPR